MIEISLAQENDLKAAGAIYCQAFNVSQSNENWTLDSANAFLLYCYHRQPDLFYLAREQSNILGGIYGEIKPWWDGNHLYNTELFVAQSHQKQKIGSKLLLTIVADALNKYRITAIEGITFRYPNFPLKWHKRLGFKIMGEMVLITGDPNVILANLQTGFSCEMKKGTVLVPSGSLKNQLSKKESKYGKTSQGHNT
jgi:GNAT superfamily N-acetyltransferase